MLITKRRLPDSAAFACLAFLRPLILGLALASLLGAPLARAQSSVEEAYIHVLLLSQQGDALKASADTEAALKKYQNAQAELNALRKAHPEYSPKVAAYRASVLSEKILEMTGGSAAVEAAATAETATSSAAANEKISSPGSEPRRELRLHPKVGDKQTIEMSLKMGMAMEMAGAEMPAMNLPPVAFTMENTVTGIAPNGDISLDLVISDVSIPDDASGNPMAEAIKPTLANMKGMTGKSVVSNRGLTKKTDFQPPAGADAQGRQMFDQFKGNLSDLGVELPAQAIGVGAKWATHSSSKNHGMNVTQNATYELVSMEEDRLVLKATTSQTAPNQKIANPAMAGQKIDLTKFTGSGSGDVTLDLSHPMVVGMQSKMHADMAMSMNLGGQKQNLGMKMDMETHLQAK